MVGVTGPLFASKRRSYFNFHLAFLAGLLISSVLVGLVALVVGSVLGIFVPTVLRLACMVAVVMFLALCDLRRKTPHQNRQTPKALIDQLGFERLEWVGLIWGIDIGTVVSTKKATSLLWGVIAYAVLLRPTMAPILLLSSSATYAVSTVYQSAIRSAHADTSLQCVMRFGKSARLGQIYSAIALVLGSVVLSEAFGHG